MVGSGEKSHLSISSHKQAMQLNAVVLFMAQTEKMNWNCREDTKCDEGI